MTEQFAPISVVIPLYNKGPYVRAALESIKAQTMQPAEIVVVDDGSADEGPEIVRSWGSGVRLLNTGTARSGPSRARNVGIEAATSEYVAFLDADDLWHIRYLELAMDAMKRFPGANGVFTDRRKFIKSLPSTAVALPDVIPMKELDFGDFLDKWVSTKSCPVKTSSCIFRKSTLIEVGMFDEHYRRGEDKDAFFRLLRSGSAVHIPLVLGFQRLGVPGQETRSIPSDMPPVVYSAEKALGNCAEAKHKRRLDLLINQEIWHYVKINRSRKPFPSLYVQKFRRPLNPLKFIIVAAVHALTLVRHRNTQTEGTSR